MDGACSIGSHGKKQKQHRTSGCETPIVMYEYQEGKSGLFAKEFLDGFSGYLHTDGYSGYNRLKDWVKLYGCWAHLRRKFNDSLITKKTSPDDCPEKTALKYCEKLFRIERKAEDMTNEERYRIRQDKSKQIVNDFFEWVKQEQEKLKTPQSLLVTAYTYAINQEGKLRRFLEDGRIEMTNNRAERSIKPFVMGRKNWLFCNTAKGAKASAIVYSIIETAKENGLNPHEYLKWVLDQIREGNDQPETLAP